MKSEPDRQTARVEAGLASTQIPSVPDYELLRRIGGGAYGEVWLARSLATGAMRAAKIVWRQRFEDGRPFQREFEGIQKFERISREHPSQLALFHIGRSEVGGYFYYVMELADGFQDSKPEALRPGESHDTKGQSKNANRGLLDFENYCPHTLRAELGQGRLPPARVLEIGLALTEALHHLHRSGLVHRDVKPSNVIFVNGSPKLADIGLVTDASDRCSIVGTEGYLPPEGPGTPQADIFSLGKVLYEAATGQDRRAFPNLPPAIKDWPDSQSVAELNEIVLKACARVAQARYESAEAMHEDLARLAQGKSVRRARRLQRRKRLLLRAAGWLAVAGAVGLLVLGSRVHPSPTPLRPEKRSTNELANRLYDLGTDHFHVFSGTNMWLAADYFQRAIQADTNFAQAYGQLAMLYTWGGFDDWNPNWEFIPRAREAALRALALDDSVADAHQALGWYHAIKEWDWSNAEKEIKRGVKLNPSLASSHLFYAEFLKVVGRLPEALDQINQAKTLDPHSRVINGRLIYYLREARQFTNALQQIDRTGAMEPDFDVPGEKRGIFCALGRLDDAIEAERQSRTSAGEPREMVDRELGELKRAIAAAGPKAYWQREVEKAKKGNNIYDLACRYAQAGDTNAALTCLEQALEQRNWWLGFMVKTDWMLDPLRSDKRFKAILKTMHLE